MPARKIISSTMMMVRVRLAFCWIGSRKALDAVGDGFDAGHGGATAGEHLDQQPGR